MRYQHHNSLGQMNEVLTELTIDGAEVVRVAHNAILVSRMHLATIALCKQTTDNFRTAIHPIRDGAIYQATGYYLFLIHE